jgi:ABC-2 type transport system ATP-binding protein
MASSRTLTRRANAIYRLVAPENRTCQWASLTVGAIVFPVYKLVGLFKEWVVAIIEVRDLVKRYGDFTAVKGISFDVQEGEIFGIVGPNGAGKTTTLEITETLKDLTSGSVIIDGYDVVKSPWQVKRRIGVQLQAAGFYPSLNLRELLELFAGLYDVKIDPMAMLRKVQLEDKAGARFEKLSGGQKQRFSIASTLVNQPRVIFLDEPSTGLDPQARLNLWDLVREIQKDGITVVLTTHYMEEAEQLSDHLAIMDEGQIVASGTPDSLIDALLARGFKKPEVVRLASLEDVFLDLTGKQLRDE